MTDDQITAALDQLAAQREQITRLDAREATHYATLTGLLAGLTARTGPDPARTTPAATSPTRPRPGGSSARTTGSEPVARLRAWVDQVYRPGYGHLAAALGPCWPAHDLCLYALDIASGLWSVLYLQPGRDPALLSAQAEYQARILPALAAQLADRNHPLRPHPPPEHAMTDDPTLRQALAYARRGWPVFPCQPGQKIPATRTATATPPPTRSRSPTGSPADPGREPGHRHRRPRPRRPGRRPATAPPGTGTPPSAGSAAPGCSTARPPTCAPPAAACTPTSPAPPSAAATCPRHHLDFRSAGGYVLAPPSQVDGHPYQLVRDPRPPRHPGLGRASPALLQPQPQQHQRPEPRPAPDRDLGHLARWVAAQPEGNRNAGLFWAANRALEADPAADLSPLADAARQAGLGDPEITRTLDSARRTGQARPEPPDHQAEAVN